MSVTTSTALERPIDLLLVTGAGASTKLGGQDDLPLMSKWSDILVEQLRTSGFYLDLVGLEPNLPGPTFEARLGRFLRAAGALDQIKDLLTPSTQLPWQQEAGQAPSDATLKYWHQNLTSHVRLALKMVRASLDESFGPDKIYPYGATQAYGNLFQELEVTPQTRLVVATTNYDVSAEIALDALGYRPDWGESMNPLGQPSNRALSVEGILEGVPRHTPVLHLHGRVNWLMTPDGVAKSSGKYQESSPDDMGVPIAMLPQLEKDYQGDAFLASMWATFKTALSQSQRVFILGHSLNDVELVDEIVTAFPEGQQVGITTRMNEDGSAHFDSHDHEALILNRLNRAIRIPMNFGPEPSYHVPSLARWRDAEALPPSLN